MDHASRHLSSPSPTSQFLFSTHSDRQLQPYKTSSSSTSSSSKSPPISPPPSLKLPSQHDHNNNNNDSNNNNNYHNDNSSSQLKRSLTSLLSPTRPDDQLECYEAGQGTSSNAQQNQLHCNEEDDHLFANNETNCNNHDNDEHNQSLETKVDNDYINNNNNNNSNNNDNDQNDHLQQHQSTSPPTRTTNSLLTEDNANLRTTSPLMNDDVGGDVHHCPIDQGSLAHVDDDVDDDDDDDGGMHNMLSGSSSSSASTLPLLTESHSHHSFSRISLGEYSPLSLVEDCDNALPISPTSLACSAHSSFKTSLNGLKMDNLDVSVGHVDHDGVNDVDVNDTRSLSPSILSSNNHHHNLWSNSSTAITQNTSLLNGTSTSFLLSHHHHQHQLSSLLQHLEPQSMDEPLIGANHNNNNNNNSQNIGGSSADGYNVLATTSLNAATTHTVSASMHRPSSEPPPRIELSEARSSQAKLKQPLSTVGSNASKLASNNNVAAEKVKVEDDRACSGSTNTLSRSTRRNQGRSNNSKQGATRNSRGSFDSITKSSNDDSPTKSSLNDSNQCYETAHDSKLHLQLNHHKKLKELQQRLFGDIDGATHQQKLATDSTASSDSNTTVISDSVQQIYDKQELVDNNSTKPIPQTITTRQRSISQASSSTQNPNTAVKQEPDSQSTSNNGQSRKIDAQNFDDKQQSNETSISRPTTRGRSARTRRRGAPSANSDQSKNLSTEQSNPQNVNESNGGEKDANLSLSINNSNKAQQKTVKTEKAEPDTTTKSSDYIKLADLLSNSSDQRTNNIGLVVSDTNSENLNSNVGDANGCNSKRVQQIQLQVSPSLTVVANGGLMHSVGVSQHQQQQTQTGTVITSTCGSSIANQILCRPHAVISSNSGQIKNLVSGNDLLNIGNTIVSSGSININGTPTTVLPNWSFNTNSNQGVTGTNSSPAANGQTIGAHQIAIQVICQDGTSLVLPVSSAAGLNAAVSLTSQHPQLQSVLSNNSMPGSSTSMTPVTMQQQIHCNQSQMLHGISVSNMVNQQQQQHLQVEGGQIMNGLNSNTNSVGAITTSGANSLSNQTATSGLAASSPTLAALLDAGSNRSVANSNDLVGSCGIGQNLLRKLVTSGNGSINNDMNMSGALGQTSSAINSAPSISLKSSHATRNGTNLRMTNGDKRIKLESNEINNNLQATFTLVEPQSAIIEEEMTNDKSTNAGAQMAVNGSARIDNKDRSTTTLTAGASNGQQQGTTKDINSARQVKNNQGSSTGNRQVDPTQPFRCEHCNSTFTRLGNFTRHKKIHTVPTKDGQRFKCEVCSKSFLQRCDLARHLHIHRGTEPHRCNICGKGYIRHSDLVTHQRFHNKEKPFGCPHCSKGFCQRGDLNRHLRSIHLQMKPILCPCCNRKFAKQETLLRHLNTAHRSKPGTNNSTNPVTADLTPNGTLASHSDERQDTISVVTSQSMMNDINNTQKNSSAPVASLQAIRATLCQVQEPVDASANPGLKSSLPPEQITTAKAVS